MTHRAPQKRSAERRTTILTAARDLLMAQGMNAVSHRRVAEAAGVSVGSVGYHFSSREELLAQCLAAEDEERTRIAGHARDGAAPDLPPQDVGERIVLTVWGEASEGLVGRVWAAMDGARESPLLQDQVKKGRAMLDADLRELLSACGYPRQYAGFALAITNGSIVNAGVEGRSAEAFACAAHDVGVLLEHLGRVQPGG